MLRIKNVRSPMRGKVRAYVHGTSQMFHAEGAPGYGAPGYNTVVTNKSNSNMAETTRQKYLNDQAWLKEQAWLKDQDSKKGQPMNDARYNAEKKTLNNLIAAFKAAGNEAKVKFYTNTLWAKEQETNKNRDKFLAQKAAASATPKIAGMNTTAASPVGYADMGGAAPEEKKSFMAKYKWWIITPVALAGLGTAGFFVYKHFFAKKKSKK